MNNTLFGIDYGSKLSGNSVIALLNKGIIQFLQVDADVDADEFIINAAKHFEPSHVFINAPLSLPGVYCKTDGCGDHQFRQADEELCTISPMVIGGLTARAIALKQNLETTINTHVLETCNKAQAKNYQLCEQGYKKNKGGLITCRNILSTKLSNRIKFNPAEIESWNHLDAFLSLISAMRYINNSALAYGNEKEGLIYV